MVKNLVQHSHFFIANNILIQKKLLFDQFKYYTFILSCNIPNLISNTIPNPYWSSWCYITLLSLTTVVVNLINFVCALVTFWQFDQFILQVYMKWKFHYFTTNLLDWNNVMSTSGQKDKEYWFWYYNTLLLYLFLLEWFVLKIILIFNLKYQAQE